VLELVAEFKRLDLLKRWQELALPDAEEV